MSASLIHNGDNQRRVCLYNEERSEYEGKGQIAQTIVLRYKAIFHLAINTRSLARLYSLD
jgi:hypothetical protein